jgi:hypothetical protein
MRLDIIGYYWDGKNHWIIYQKPNGTMIRKKDDKR